MTLTSVLPIFPDFAPGQSTSRQYPLRYPGWEVKVSHEWNNYKQRTPNGITRTVKYWSNPLHHWEFNYPVLFDDPSMLSHGVSPYYQGFPIPYTDYQILKGFFDDAQGDGNQFLFQPADSAFGGTANITSITGLNNYFTITAANSYLPGMYAVFTSLVGATFLNSQTLQILAATPSQFVVYFAHANYGPSPESSVPVFAGQLLGSADSNKNVELVKQIGGYPVLPLTGTPWSAKQVVESVQVIDSSTLVVKANAAAYSSFTLSAADAVAPYQGLVLQGTGSTPTSPIVAAFNYFYVCRMAEGLQEYANFMAMLWAAKSFKFTQDRL